jgi:hypothetical protein
LSLRTLTLYYNGQFTLKLKLGWAHADFYIFTSQPEKQLTNILKKGDEVGVTDIIHSALKLFPDCLSSSVNWSLQQIIH